MAVYPGSTIDLVRRIYAHKKRLKLARQGILYQGSVQHVHREMGKQGHQKESPASECKFVEIMPEKFMSKDFSVP